MSSRVSIKILFHAYFIELNIFYRYLIVYDLPCHMSEKVSYDQVNLHRQNNIINNKRNIISEINMTKETFRRINIIGIISN